MSSCARSWYYVDKAGKTVGPKTTSELKPLYASKIITDKTYVWNGTTVETWTVLKKVPSIQRQLKPAQAAAVRQTQTTSNKSNESKLARLFRTQLGSPKAAHDAKSKPAHASSHKHQHQHRHTKTHSAATAAKTVRSRSDRAPKPSKVKSDSSVKSDTADKALGDTNPFSSDERSQHEQKQEEEPPQQQSGSHGGDGDGGSDDRNTKLTVFTQPALRVTRCCSQTSQASTVSSVSAVSSTSTEHAAENAAAAALPGAHLRLNMNCTRSESNLLSPHNHSPSSLYSPPHAGAYAHAHGHAMFRHPQHQQQQHMHLLAHEEASVSVSAEDIDAILDEIEQNELKQQELRRHVLNNLGGLQPKDTMPIMSRLIASKSQPLLLDSMQSAAAAAMHVEEEEAVGDHVPHAQHERHEELRSLSVDPQTEVHGHGHRHHHHPTHGKRNPNKLLPFAVRPGVSINWDQMAALRFRQQNIHSIRKILGSHSVDINSRNPRDGTTLLMHAIIIGDTALVQEIVKCGADILMRDNDGDDAIDYALIFQRYKVTEMLLMLKRRLTSRKLATLVERKNGQARYMLCNTFGKFHQHLVRFVMKALRERQPFDTNLLYAAWYFVNHATDRVTGHNPFPDPLSTPLFKCMMKIYDELLKSGRSDKHEWQWFRTHVIESIIWLLPHPKTRADAAATVAAVKASRDESDDDETDDDDDEEDDDGDEAVSSPSKNKRTQFIQLTKKLKGIPVSKHSGHNLLLFLFL